MGGSTTSSTSSNGHNTSFSTAAEHWSPASGHAGVGHRGGLALRHDGTCSSVGAAIPFLLHVFSYRDGRLCTLLQFAPPSPVRFVVLAQGVEGKYIKVVDKSDSSAGTRTSTNAMQHHQEKGLRTFHVDKTLGKSCVRMKIWPSTVTTRRFIAKSRLLWCSIDMPECVNYRTLVHLVLARGVCFLMNLLALLRRRRAERTRVPHSPNLLLLLHRCSLCRRYVNANPNSRAGLGRFVVTTLS